MAETDERIAGDAADGQAVGTLQPEVEAVPVPVSVAQPEVAPSPPSLPSQPLATPPTPPTRSIRVQTRTVLRRRRWRLTGNIALALLVIGTALMLAWPVPPAQPARPAVVLIVPRADGVECARDAEWAPDGTRLVVLGYARTCPTPTGSATSTGGTVLVYSALSGALLSRIQPDALITRAAGAAPGSDIEYTGALWSPDGTRLAVMFGVTTSGQTTEGLYLSDANGGHAKVLLRAGAPAAAQDPNTGMWDLQAGTFVPAPPLAPALGYSWSSGGALVPSTPLSATTAPIAPQPGAVGVPDGGIAFSSWQPATITLRASRPASQPAADGAYVLSSTFAVWSPDGRYLFPSAGIQARVPSADSSTPSQGILAALGLAATPLLPVRDRALQVALDRLAAVAPEERGNSPMLVAWSPDGRLLAVQLVPAEPHDVPHISHHALLIYDCATGKALIALTPDDATRPTEGPTFVRWSPNGARLMLFDNQMGTLTIFGRSKIPQS